MTNEMKLLMALCDALGYKVETIVDWKESKIDKAESKRLGQLYNPKRKVWRLALTEGRSGLRYEIDEDGMYTKMLIEPETSYTLTKRHLL